MWGNVVGYLICSETDYIMYVSQGMLPESGYRRVFFLKQSNAEGFVLERPKRNLYILKFKVPKKWIDRYYKNEGIFECTHQLNLHKYLKAVMK